MAGTSDTKHLLCVLENWRSYYIETIQDWRQQLKARSVPVQYNGQTVTYMELPSKNSEPKFKEIVLRTSENTITLKIRTFDLYIVGYKNSNSGWFEFREKKSGMKKSNTKKKKKKSNIKNAEQADHLIPESTFLDYSGSYDDLLNNIGDFKWDEIQFSEKKLKSAINYLGYEKNDNKQKRAKALLVLVIMIPEALRFQRILTLVPKEPGQDGKSTSSQEWIRGLVTDWKKLSKSIKDASMDESQEFERYTIEQSDPNGDDHEKIETFKDACDLVRLVKYSEAKSARKGKKAQVP